MGSSTHQTEGDHDAGAGAGVGAGGGDGGARGGSHVAPRPGWRLATRRDPLAESRKSKAASRNPLAGYVTV